ncbi:MAG TPA: LacI family DNA-binding transcriptional regulator [Lachnospiraceae bacterium]|nr:LacI family DNA-binding transcriptional regulator [Lachnospiraceae bacterium]
MGENPSTKAQIKEMAASLGLSPTTVSVVLNGRGDGVRIAKETQKKIQELAKEMNYQPNIYARRLRKAATETAPMIITIFWRVDNLNSRLGRFLSGLYEAINKRSCQVEIVIQPYEAGSFHRYIEMLNSFRCSGVMISGLTEMEQTALEERDFDIPVILIGRNSAKFHCVLMDNYRAGKKCSSLLETTHTRTAAFIGFQKGGQPEHHMEDGFLQGCQSLGIQIKEEWNLRLEKSNFEIGYQAAVQLFGQMALPAAWMIMDNRLSSGILAACKDHSIKIPQDLKLVFLEESEMLKYNKPALSSLDVPVRDMAEKALDILLLVNENKINIPIKRELLPTYHIRESSGLQVNG